ncbi:MAG: adenylate kinase [Parcubacteria group bacterium]|nr:adenylate kinase [Parcubacteria group bacterium]
METESGLLQEMVMNPIKTVLLHGKPGAGKGTQAKLLIDGLGWRYCGTGDFFRDQAKHDNELGRRIRIAYETGTFLPQWLITRLFVNETMCLNLSQGIVFDGFARTSLQASEIHSILSWFERPYLVINLEVSDSIALQRIAQRNLIEDRTDGDSLEKLQKRFSVHRNLSEPALTIFENANGLKRIDGERPIEVVHQDILDLLQSY